MSINAHTVYIPVVNQPGNVVSSKTPPKPTVYPDKKSVEVYA
jgi:hypothetical protein